jgi:hypothetical protein
VSEIWKDPTLKKGGKRFRRRFRVPYPCFVKILEISREREWFSEAPDCTGRPGAPLELKILGALQVLGRGYCFDGVEELCYISEETIREETCFLPAVHYIICYFHLMV